MTIDAIEDAVASAAIAQGFRATSASMTEAAIQLAGSTLANSLIVIPGKGSISPGDFVRDLRARMPEGFTSLDAEPDAKPAGTLTERMRQEIAATRRKQSMPDDFNTVRARYSADSLTGRMMDELAATRR